MKKFYTLSVFIGVLILATVNESYAQHNFYISTNRNLSSQNLALCTGNGGNSCNFYVGWDGASNYLSNITLSADVNCNHCTFYSVNSTDKIVVTNNITFTNTSLAGAYLVINGHTLTLGSNLSVNTTINNTPNSHFNNLASTIIVGDAPNNVNASSINLNGNDININGPVSPATNVSNITLGELNSSIYDNTSGFNGDIIYNYNYNSFFDTYFSSKNLFSADGGFGNNAGTSPVPYTNLGGGHYELVGASTSSLNGSSSIFVTITPLPVILVNFNASLNTDNTVAITWSTEQEQNSSYFSIEKSADGENWTSVGIVPAQGNSSTVTDYSFTDNTPLTEVNYYRLQAFDLDGKYTYSDVDIVRTTAIQNLSVLPNPARSYVNVFLGKASTVDLTVKLVNASGQVVQSKILGAGGTSISLPVGNYPAGIYLLHISGSNGLVQTTKVFITR